MSTLTKVFVVLLVIFSIAFTMLTVSVVSQTPTWRKTAESNEQAANYAETNLRLLIAAHTAEVASLKDTINADRATIADLEKELQRALNDLAERRAELAQAASGKSSAEAMSSGLASQLQSATSIAEEYRTQRNNLETRNLDLEQRNSDLSDRVIELTEHLAVLTQQKRQFEQQINILKGENQRLASAARISGSGSTMESAEGAAMAGIHAESPVASVPVRGNILEVNGNVVTISVGSADGVKEGMVFVITRDNEYVGDVKIAMVDPNEAVGRLVQSEYQPTAGDKVTDAASLGSSRG